MKAKSKRKNSILILSGLLVLSVIFIDQSFKLIFKDTSVCNNGAFLGMKVFDNFLVIPLLCVLFYFLFKEKRFYALIGYSLLAAGGISNLIDRYIYGCVLDFIPLLMISKFNIADAAITVGLILTAFQIFSKKDA